MNKNRYVLVVSIILIGIVSLIILNNKLDNKETVLDEVKLKENRVDNKSFAIMIQKEDKTGYDVYEENTWPSEGYTFNNELSGCIDNYGSIIENSLSYNQETNKVTINTGVTSSCYVYFDIYNPIPLGEYLLSNSSAGLNTITAYGGMYRYIGNTADNYVKLGNVLYRIIGITTTTDRNTELCIEPGQLKLIKADYIGTYQWHKSNPGDISWESSNMFSYLQSANVLQNPSVIPSDWVNAINNVYWNHGAINTAIDTTADLVYEKEDDSKTNSTSKIGLLYISDYYYAHNTGGTIDCSTNSCINWLTDTSNTTWTMTRHSSISGRYGALYIGNNGYVTGTYNLPGIYAVRPVFYLNSTVKRTNGSGTSTDPFIVSQ